MGVYLNPGNDMFQMAINSEIYVDKTELIRITNKVLGTMQKFVCISRPRRFGKSMAAYMLSGERVQIHTERFQNDMTTFESKDDVLTLLVHLGYLAYDSESSEVFIPNTEIRGELIKRRKGIPV